MRFMMFPIAVFVFAFLAMHIHTVWFNKSGAKFAFKNLLYAFVAAVVTFVVVGGIILFN